MENTSEEQAKRLLEAFSKLNVQNALVSAKVPIPNSSAKIIASTWSNYEHMAFYNDPTAIEVTLDTIDLPKIYLGVDKQESELESATGSIKLGYEDHLVKETLKYFRNDFFKWMNKPKCSSCLQDGDNMEHTGTGRPSSPGPHLVSIVEVYRCRNCRREATFPRINNPVSLLETRTGRCGEWVNCFLLVLKAVLGTDSKLRYVWNHEDHVWCEYYSRALCRWIHLDPCESSWDEPSLYCENWGKQMSWVIGIGEHYVVDLSSKYITKGDKQIPKSLVADEKAIDLALRRINARLAEKLWIGMTADSGPTSETYTLFYEVYLLPKRKEMNLLKLCQATGVDESNLGSSSTDLAPKGRQSGSSSWTAARGEDGQGKLRRSD